MAPLVGCQRLGESALVSQGNTEVAVGLGVLRVDFDGLLKAGDGFVHLALGRQRIAQVVPGLGELRVDFDGLLKAGDGLVQLALFRQRVPKLSWAMANFGSSSMAILKQAMASSHWPLAFST